MRQLACCLLSLTLCLMGRTVAAQEVGTEFFEKKIRPVLIEHCYKCHSHQAKRPNPRGGLYLDSKAGMLEGGATGPAIVPGKPNESLLILAVRHTAGELKMPKNGKLAPEIVTDLEKWVAMGAPDPRVATAKPERKRDEIDIEEGRKFWAFQPPKRPNLPAVRDAAWADGTIDRLILAGLEEKDVRPVADADRPTLIRRAYYSLIGLPPTPEEVDAFVKDPSPDAFARVVDGLLASPHFGERWGRHWLDVARFSESSGGGRTLLFKEAWRYRDYVIRSFNLDKPYDQFLMEQVAGDLLPYLTPEQRYDFLVATGYLTLGPTNYERQDKPTLEMDVIDEQLDTIGKSMLGMTIGCARCHDHKFDPIPTKDYYALAGIFKSTRTLIHDNVSRWVEQLLPLPPALEAPCKLHDAAVATLTKQIDLARKAKPATAVKELETQLKQLQAAAPNRPMAMTVAEAEKTGDFHVCVRGDVRSKGAMVKRGFLQVATVGTPPAIAPGESGRRQLALWIASRDNPLTARVMANRVWHHLFGAGLVRTVDNFGSTGERPSHPELLDYLALRFVEQGWSVKKLIREIMLSRAYRLSSGPNPQAAAIDPDNRLVWRMNRRRLDAEALRDTMLVVAGKLDRSGGGPSVKPGTKAERDYVFDDVRRSVYTPIFRNRLLELFEAFDFPDPNTVLGKRNVSTVATQALYLMNSPFVLAQARAAAQKALAQQGVDSDRLDTAYRTAIGRLPTPRERELAIAYLRQTPERVAGWERLFQVLFACVDFRYLE
jgi:Protein of unknown function (DUF1553)/Protein of unknown function (DUF1549)/Planctomycete cytochrome C